MDNPSSALTNDPTWNNFVRERDISLLNGFLVCFLTIQLKGMDVKEQLPWLLNFLQNYEYPELLKKDLKNFILFKINCLLLGQMELQSQEGKQREMMEGLSVEKYQDFFDAPLFVQKIKSLRQLAILNLLIILHGRKLEFHTENNPYLFDIDQMSIIFKKLQGYIILDIDQLLKNIETSCQQIGQKGLLKQASLLSTFFSDFPLEKIYDFCAGY